MDTTVDIYADVSPRRRGEIIREITSLHEAIGGFVEARWDRELATLTAGNGPRLAELLGQIEKLRAEYDPMLDPAYYDGDEDYSAALV